MRLHKLPEGGEVRGGKGEGNVRRRLAGLSLDGWEEAHGGEDAGRLAWQRSPYTTNPATRPAPWWGYTPGVPPELRGSGGLEDLEDWTLQAKRLRWLLGPVGKRHLRGGERPHVRRRLAQFERLAQMAEEHESNDPRTWPSALR